MSPDTKETIGAVLFVSFFILIGGAAGWYLNWFGIALLTGITLLVWVKVAFQFAKKKESDLWALAAGVLGFVMIGTWAIPMLVRPIIGMFRNGVVRIGTDTFLR